MHTEIEKRAPSKLTWLGLLLSLFGMLVARAIVNHYWPALTFEAALWKEGLIWLCTVAVLLIILKAEKLPLTSVGIGTSTFGKSLGWGLLLTLVCFIVAVILAAVTGYGHGPASEAMAKLPLWLITLIVTRAGIVEEFFFRGYAIERLQMVGLSRPWAAIIPLVIFSVGHWTGGWANIVIALALGIILTLSYLWRRDLIANMIGHFMVDFIPNVLGALFHG